MKYPQEVYQLHYQYNSFWGADSLISAIDMYSETWSCNFLLLNISRGDIDGLSLGRRQSVLYSWFWTWNEVFPMGIRHDSFETCRKILDVVGTMVPLRGTMITLLSCIINF